MIDNIRSLKQDLMQFDPNFMIGNIPSEMITGAIVLILTALSLNGNAIINMFTPFDKYMQYMIYLTAFPKHKIINEVIPKAIMASIVSFL